MTHKPVRALLFSWENVLLDARATREACLMVQWQSFLDELLHVPARRYVQVVGGEMDVLPADVSAAYGRALRRLELPSGLLPHLLRDYRAHWGRSPRLFPGALNTLRRLSHVMQTALVASGRESDFRASLKASGMAPYFHVVEIADNPGLGAPVSPETISRALQRLSVPAERAVFIGVDLEGTLAAARRAGLHTVWLRPPGSDGSHRAGTDAVVENIHDLPHELRDLAGMPAG